jgi:hypothetical protein
MKNVNMQEVVLLSKLRGRKMTGISFLVFFFFFFVVLRFELLLSASQVTRIIGVSHWHPSVLFILRNAVLRSH